MADGTAVSARRLQVVGALALIAWAGVAARLFAISVISRDAWVKEAERQQQRTVRLDPDRGSLLDRDGTELAVSVPAFSAWADPSALGGDVARRAAAGRLASVLDVDATVLRSRLRQDREFVWLERKLPPRQRDAVQALRVPGVAFAKESRRLYPQGTLAAHALGIVSTDGDGLEGLEHVLDPQVAGRPGLLLTMKDARGEEFLPGGVSFQPPVRGRDVVLTLDSVIQHVVERELSAAMARTHAMAGTVIVMFPLTGEIAALSNQPTYDPNNFPAHPSHLRTNRAVASCYEPGSTLKIFTAAAALEHGVRPGDLFDCENGSTRIGRTRLRDHESFGTLSASEILARSSNIGAIKLGRRSGRQDLGALLRRFGFGQRTGIELPGESAGILRDPASWSPLTLACISFGQEIAVTPLQLVTAACAVAAGGVLPVPTLVRCVREADGSVTTPKRTAGRRVLAPAAARTLEIMLEGVIDHGTAQAAAIPGWRVAGKTGTAQKAGPSGGYEEGAYVASFVGWAPARDPAFVALVVLDEPQGAYHGGDVAAPVFASIGTEVMRHLRVPPEDPQRILPLDAEAPDERGRPDA